MSDILAKKGTQIWNKDRTAGFELTKDILRHERIMAHHVSPLGSSPKPIDGAKIPDWFAKIALYKGKLEEYLSEEEKE